MKMHILNVDSSFDPVVGGGTAERTFQISRALVKAHVGCSILTLARGVTPARVAALPGVAIYPLPCLSGRFYLPGFSLRVITDAVIKADVIHIMSHWTMLNALVYLICRRLRKPYVVCPAGALPIYGRSKTLKRIYNLVIGKRIVRNAAACVAINQAEAEHFLAYGVAPEKIVVIPNGVSEESASNTQDAAFRLKYNLADAPFILFVGRLNHIKGPDLLLQAFAGLPPELSRYHLVFAGPDGGMFRELQETASAQKLSGRVHFLGYLGGEDKSCAYSAAALLAIPSRQEAMSIVVLEAGISGTPVLLTDRCGFNAVASVSGGKVVPASMAGLRAGLVEMLSNDPGLRVAGQNLKEFVKAEFLWDSVILGYIKLYSKVVEMKS